MIDVHRPASSVKTESFKYGSACTLCNHTQRGKSSQFNSHDVPLRTFAHPASAVAQTRSLGTNITYHDICTHAMRLHSSARHSSSGVFANAQIMAEQIMSADIEEMWRATPPSHVSLLSHLCLVCKHLSTGMIFRTRFHTGSHGYGVEVFIFVLIRGCRHWCWTFG